MQPRRMSESLEVQTSFLSRPSNLWLRRRYRSAAQRHRGAAISRATESAVIFVLAMVVYLLIGEMAVRLVTHAPLFEIRDFRHERAARTINRAVQYDSVLG